MPSYSPEAEIEEHIRKEFRAALNEMERASGNQKADAAARLSRAMRRLYDLVGYGKTPPDLNLRRSPCS
ncbi:MAG TPA: hypothetical protein VGF16_14970 [Bryobacteraceae bacterium]